MYKRQGSGEAFRAALRDYTETVEALDLPFFHFVHAMLSGSGAVLAGRLDEAERLAHEAYERGRAVESPNAHAVLAAQLFTIRSRQQRQAELLPVLRAATDRPDSPPAFVGALAAATAAMGNEAETRRVLAKALPALDALPRDHSWLGAVVALAQVASAVGDPEAVRALRATLVPYAGRLAVAGHGAAIVGSVDGALAGLATRAGDALAAARHDAAARALRERVGPQVDPPPLP